MSKVIILNKNRVLRLKKTATQTHEKIAASLRANGHEAIVASYPSIKSLEKWTMGSVSKTPDGCKVEPDGTCPHGYPSWLLLIGVI